MYRIETGTLDRRVVLDRVRLGPHGAGRLPVGATGEVSGRITDYWWTYYPSTTRHEWGETIGPSSWARFVINALAFYSAPGSRYTEMQVRIWKPGGGIVESADGDLWPYASPGEEIHFVVGRPPTLGFAPNELGDWYAELTYVG